MSLCVVMAAACPYPVPQGSQVYLRATARALQRRGHDVRLVVYAHGQGEAPPDLPVTRAPGVPGHQRTAAGPSWAKPLADAGLAWTLRRAAREADVVCAHNYEALLAGIAARRRPLVYFAHNLLEDELPAYFRRGRGAWARLGRWLDRALPARADAVVAPHARLAEALCARGCKLARVHVVPPPADAAEFAVCVHGSGTPPVLYAGNLDAYQNLPLLLAAMERVRTRIPEARLRVATADTGALPGAEMQHVADFAALRELLAEPVIFAVPRVSWSGYPIKLLNAMAAGQAIVACASAAHPLTHEADGLVVPDGDAAAFADALERLLGDAALRARLGGEARRTVEERHGMAAAGIALEQVLRAVRI